MKLGLIFSIFLASTASFAQHLDGVAERDLQLKGQIAQYDAELQRFEGESHRIREQLIQLKSMEEAATAEYCAQMKALGQTPTGCEFSASSEKHDPSYGESQKALLDEYCANMKALGFVPDCCGSKE